MGQDVTPNLGDPRTSQAVPEALLQPLGMQSYDFKRTSEQLIQRVVPRGFAVTVLVAAWFSPRPWVTFGLAVGLTAVSIGLSVLDALRLSGPVRLLHTPVAFVSIVLAFIVGIIVSTDGLGWYVALPSSSFIPFYFHGRTARLVGGLYYAACAAAVGTAGGTDHLPLALAVYGAVYFTMPPIIDHLRRVHDDLKRNAFALGMKSNELQRHQTQLEDLVDEKTAEARQAQRRAEEAHAAKNLFLANMTHELRTPLHGILSFNRFATRKFGKASAEKMKGYFTQIDTNATLLLGLVNNLLDLSKLDAGAMKLTVDPDVDVQRVTADLLSEFSTRYDDKSVRLACDAPDAFGFAADRTLLCQVLRNLLSNALKFAPADSTVTLRAHLVDDVVQFEVCDEGPGVPVGEEGLIFESFQQSSHTRSGAGGTGLGLAICKNIIELHGGRIWVANAPDGGACFHVHLPRRRDHAKNAA